MIDYDKGYQDGVRYAVEYLAKGYQDGVRDAVEYLAEVYGEGIYETSVFDRLEVTRYE